MAIPLPYYIFSKPPTLLTSFCQHQPNKIRDKHKNKLTRESFFFMFRGLQIKVACFFFLSNIYRQPLPFLQKNLQPTFDDYSKIVTLTNNGGGRSGHTIILPSTLIEETSPSPAALSADT